MKKNRFDDRKLFITLQKNSIDEIISFLEPFGIDSYDRDGRTMLMNLIIEGKEELLKAFMEFNPNVNSQDFNGYSALHFAVQEKFTAAIDLLLDKEELQVDLQDKWGNTPLLRLVWEENIDNMELISKLIEKGASLELPNNYGVTARSSMQEITEKGTVDYSRFLV